MNENRKSVSAPSVEVPVLLTKEQVADYFAVSIRTIEDWRYRGIGPKPVKIGRTIRWRASDLAAFVEGLSNE